MTYKFDLETAADTFGPFAKSELDKLRYDRAHLWNALTRMVDYSEVHDPSHPYLDICKKILNECEQKASHE